MTKTKQRYALGAATALVGAFLAIGLHWLQEREEIKAEAAAQLSAIADLKREEIVNWRNERLADGRFFSRAPFVVKDVEALLADPQAEPARSNAQRWLTLLKGGDRYAQVRIFRPDFSELIAVSTDPSKTTAPVPGEIAAALAAREPQLTDLHRDSDPGLHIDVLVPVFPTTDDTPPTAEPAQPIAAIIMRLDPEQFLFPLIQKWPLPSPTAETVLAHREGDEVVYMNKLRHRQNAAPRFPISAPNLPMAIAMRGQTGLIEGPDYRGVPVLAFIGPIPGSPWFMAAKVDQAEIYAPLREQALSAGGMALALALAILGGAGWLWRREETVYLRRELASENARLAGEQRLRTLGDNIPGGAIYQFVAPPAGPTHYAYMSAGIENIFGIPAERVMTDAAAFWQLIHPEDRERLEADQARSARDLTLFDCEFRQHTISGEVKWIHARSTPRRLGDGTVIWDGVAADVTERKRAEEVMKERLALQERIATIATTVPGVIYTFRVAPDGTASFPYASRAAVEYFGFEASVVAADASPIFAAIHRDDVGEVQASIAESARTLTPWSREFRYNHPKKGLIWVMAMSEPRREADGGTLWHGFTMEVTDLRKTEAALTAERSTLKTLFQALPDLVWLKDLEGVYLACNPRFEQFYGATEAEIVGKTDFDFTSAEQASLFRENDLTAIRAGGPSVNLEELTFAADGHREWVETIKTPMLDAQGQLIGVLGIARDITASRRAQATIIASEKRFRDVASSVAGWVWETDAQGHCTFASDTVETILGYKPDEVLGQKPDFFMEPEEAQRVGRIAGELFAKKSPMRNFETWKRHKDGRLVCLLANALPVLDTDGNLMGYRGVDIDITERKRAEAALEETQARFRELADNVTEVFWITEPDTNRVLYVSPAYEKIWGCSCESVYADPESWKAAMHPDDVAQVEKAVRLRMPAGTSDQTYRIRRPDGTERWIHDRAFPVRDADGKIVRIVGVAQDVTESRKLEAQFLQAQKMEAIGQLAGGVAHDFNNILSVITIHTDLLTATLPEDDPTRDSLMDIQRAAERAAALTRQLLVFSRQQVVEPKVLDLNSAVADSEKMLCRLIGEDVCLETRLNPGLSAVKIDPGHLSQVVMNLAVNARDAMPQGGRLTIETHHIELDETFAQTHAEVKPGPHVLLTVTDTGCGMSPEVLSRIWEPFFTTKGAGRGTGLGLAVVHGIVKQAGGYLSVYSEVGIGTTFKIYLPSVTGSAPKSSARANAQLARGSETILLVDDEDAFRSVSAVALQHLGYQVLVANGGRQALALAAAHSGQIDLLLTDVVMPDMGGRPLAEALQARSPSLKVLYQSGYTDDAVVRHGILQAEVAFLQKPFTLAALAAKVREALDR